ncbi:PfkB family carbohydrate kinase [Actinokineospora iranica]|uniref:Ribokinase n=1 Tax=Actinokineospora iranica TaxID=1271860 RepID=A0A1G6QGT0_9PSEU|nr:PfkB family carbohydrate kinase [Actinokineospora iranica]SDC91528.1 ribokinase [Actinokineospora iranica]
MVVDVVVLGQIARDLVLVVPEVPSVGGTTPVRRRREMLGGKGANIAVALAQLGASVGLVGVVGDDEVGGQLIAKAAADGVDTAAVARRPGVETGLITEVLTEDGGWRYLEDLPEHVLLTEADVVDAEPMLTAASTVVVQLQQPAAAVHAAVRLAKAAGRRVVLDGAPPEDACRKGLLAAADVLRADHREGEALTGVRLDSVDAARRAGRALLAEGPSLVALAVDGVGNVFVWSGGHLALPLVGDAVDTTGGGDSFVAAMTWALLRGADPRAAARLAVAASGATVGRPGGRPELTPQVLRTNLARLDLAMSS